MSALSLPIADVPALTLASPFVTVIAAVIAANVAFRVGVPGMSAAVAAIGGFLCVGAVVFLALVIMPKGSVRVDENGQLRVARTLLGGGSVDLARAEAQVQPWLRGSVQPQKIGLIVRLDDGSREVVLGLTGPEIYNAWIDRAELTTAMPSARLDIDDSTTLLAALNAAGVRMRPGGGN